MNETSSSRAIWLIVATCATTACGGRATETITLVTYTGPAGSAGSAGSGGAGAGGTGSVPVEPGLTANWHEVARIRTSSRSTLRGRVTSLVAKSNEEFLVAALAGDLNGGPRNIGPEWHTVVGRWHSWTWTPLFTEDLEPASPAARDLPFINPGAERLTLVFRSGRAKQLLPDGGWQDLLPPNDSVTLAFGVAGEIWMWKGNFPVEERELTRFSDGRIEAFPNPDVAYPLSSMAAGPDGSLYAGYAAATSTEPGKGYLNVFQLRNRQWRRLGLADFVPTDIESPRLAISRQGVAYASIRTRDANKLQFLAFRDEQWQPLGEGLEIAGGLRRSALPELVMSNAGSPHTLYTRATPEGLRTFVARWQNERWSDLGAREVANSALPPAVLAFAPDDTLYIAFVRTSSSGHELVIARFVE